MPNGKPGTPGKSQDSKRLTEIGTMLMRWDSISINSVTQHTDARAELNTSYLDLPNLGFTPQSLAELQQEFRDVDTKMVTEIQTYANSLTPIT